MTTVTLVTKDSTLDSMSVQDYADAFAELRQTAGSLDKLVALLGSGYSKATWNKFERNEFTLTRQMRNEIRRGVGLPELPLTVAEATAQASPDAAVWRIGSDTPEHVIMVAGGIEAILHVNGTVTVGDTLKSANVPEGTGTTRRLGTVTVSRATKAQNERRKALQASWADIIERGLKSLEQEREK